MLLDAAEMQLRDAVMGLEARPSELDVGSLRKWSGEVPCRQRQKAWHAPTEHHDTMVSGKSFVHCWCAAGDPGGTNSPIRKREKND